MILATKSSTPIIGQLATVMGWIMDGIYRLLNIFGIQNIGICIVIFSILIYALMTPLQIKQQKFSKLSAIMQPELQKIQKKYKGKNNDTAAMQKMQEETQAVYQKYGVSPTGSCVQLAIQFPILMALYQVIYKIPAYVGSVRDILASAVTSITGVNGYTDILQQFITDNKMTRVQLIMDGSKATSNSVTDFLYALSPSQWKTLAETSQFAGFTDTLNSTAKEISHVQNFFGLNIADQPLTYIKAAFVGGSVLLAIVAILIPILAWATQMINLKLMPQAAQQSGDSQQDAMMNSMKTMNMVMPLMSAVFCFTFPVGLGIYWVASAAVRSVIAELFCHLEILRAVFSLRRSVIVRHLLPGHLGKKRGVVVHLFLERGKIRDRRHIGMMIGMVPHRMSLRHHPLGNLRRALQKMSHHKESGRRLVLF